MIFWVLAVILTLIAACAALLPLMRVSTDASAKPSSVATDRAIYQARIAEIEKDQAIGRISAEDGEAAKAQAARQLIALADGAANVHQSPLSLRTIYLVLAALVIAVPLITVSLYLKLGSPQLPDQQLADRTNNKLENDSIEQLLSRAEARLQQNPDDARGWEVVTPVYMKLGRYEDAQNALRNSIRLQGESAKRLTLLAEAMAFAENGIINVEGKELIARALQLEPANLEARYLSAIVMQQENRLADAKSAWQSLIAEANKGPSANPALAQAAKAQLAALEGGAAGGNTSPAQADKAAGGATPGNPDESEVAAAATMDANSRNAMIEGMVGRLRQKLKDDPTNKEGWLRLVRSYKVLGKTQELAEALAEVKKTFADDPQFLAEIEQIAADNASGADPAATQTLPPAKP